MKDNEQDSEKETEQPRIVLEATGAKQIVRSEIIQTLWSGYGEIVRMTLKGGDVDSVIVKSVQPPALPAVDTKKDSGGDTSGQHPRGWNTDRSHRRKLRSYEVEAHWYRHYSNLLGSRCPVARCYRVTAAGGRWVFVLQDLDAAGFEVRRQSLDPVQVRPCLTWLASFHASFLGCKPDGLWPVGTYWHLDTRPDEWSAISDPHPLKTAAGTIDEKLTSCKYQTLVHGDAKVANFCFSRRGDRVAAVDFQYVGGGCGVKDVAYLLGSCLDEDQCRRFSQPLLNFYFEELQRAVQSKRGNGTFASTGAVAPSGDPIDIQALQAEWRSMYPLAWADFHRFLLGWYPAHQKLHGYAREMTQLALDSLP